MSAVTIKAPHNVKIRKQHICRGCGKTLNIGETVTSSTYGDGGDIWTFYECDECSKYRDTKCFKCKDFEYCMGENYEVGLIKNCKKESLFN